MRISRVTALTAAGLATLVCSTPAVAGAATTACPLPAFGSGATYHPTLDPAGFTADVDNPWFPLKVGTTLIYEGTKDGKTAVDTFRTTAATRTIDGVRTRVVEDRLYLDGILEERTSDYFAQDSCDNVWYLGEDTATLDEHGNVISTDGSFHAGVDGAQPGVVMQAQPEEGRRFRQEWYPGQAEDTFRVVDDSVAVTVPDGAFSSALRTEERTALEPNVIDNKFYARDIGQVEELAVRGPTEKLVLVDVED